MKSSTFHFPFYAFLIVLFSGMSFKGHSQTITGGCDKVTVTDFPIYDYDLYLCCAWATESNPCLDILVNGFAAKIKMDLEKYNYSTSQWVVEVSSQHSTTSNQFTGLSSGRYRV